MSSSPSITPEALKALAERLTKVAVHDRGGDAEFYADSAVIQKAAATLRALAVPQEGEDLCPRCDAHRPRLTMDGRYQVCVECGFERPNLHSAAPGRATP